MIRIALIFSLFTAGLIARESPPTMKNISRFEDDRLSFHYIHNLDKDGNRSTGSDPRLDPSLATLLIIKDSQTYIFRDGYDDKQDVNQRMKEYQQAVSRYRTRRGLLKEFRSIEDERKRIESQSEEFRTKSDNTERQMHSLFQKYDPIYRTIELDKKKATSEEYRQRRFSGLNSPSHKKAIESLEDIKKEQEERLKFVTEFLRNEDQESLTTSQLMDTNSGSTTSTNKAEMNALEIQKSQADNIPRKFTPILPAPNPGEWSEMNFYKNNADGTLDYMLYSRSARTIDFEKKDSKDSKLVSEKFSQLYQTLIDRLIKAHVEKFKYYFSHKSETASRTIIEPNPTGKGKRLILLGGDNTRYTLEDWDGDGKVETFEVSNSSYPFRWASDSANIISITNCSVEKYCALFQGLLEESELGSFSTLETVKSSGQSTKYLGSEDELLRDWEDLLQK